MPRFTGFLFAVLVLTAGCGNPETEEPAVDDAATMAVERPDPENPAENPEGELPPDWMWRFDRAGEYTVGGGEQDSVDTWFVTMTPGWHITTAPAGIFYHPAHTAEGAYTASAKIHLFPPGNRNEGYGILVGGSDLQGPGQEYLYFLIRRSGEYLVKLRRGSETEELIGWTPHEAIVAFTEETETTATNTLAVRMEGDMVTFLVNETEVASLPQGELPTDGLVGLRMNHSVNVHVSEFAVTPAA